MKPSRRPCWATVNEWALHDENLPRVLAAMGFDHYCGTVAQGDIRWWQPAYLSAATPAAVAAWFPPRAADVREACIAEFVGRRRAEVAPINRRLRDAPVALMALGTVIYAVDTRCGEWRTADGAQRGHTLITLGMLRWGLTFGRAGYRIARLCSIDVPTVEEALLVAA